MDHDDLLRRAYAAYFKSGGFDQPNRQSSGVHTVDGLTYVVLVVRGLVVYRVDSVGRLKRLKRWPKQLDDLT